MLIPIYFAVMSHKFTEERDEVWSSGQYGIDEVRDDDWALVFDDFCACYYAWDGIT
jgi:hypothetical protein